MGTLAILLNKLIATLHQGNFSLLHEGGLLLQGTMDYYLWSRPQNKPFFETRSKQKTFLAVVGRQESSPGDVGFRARDKAHDRPVSPARCRSTSWLGVASHGFLFLRWWELQVPLLKVHKLSFLQDCCYVGALPLGPLALSLNCCAWNPVTRQDHRPEILTLGACSRVMRSRSQPGLYSQSQVAEFKVKNFEKKPS